MMWDWSYPQFLASERRHEERLLDRLPELVSVTPGVEYPPDAAELGLVGWSTGFWSNAISLDPFRLGIPPWWPEEGRRWSEGASGRVYFTLDQEQMDNVSGQFDLKLDSYGSQRLNITLNGQPAHSFITAGSPAQESRVLTTFSVDPNMLRSGLNELQFEFPDRVQVGKVSDFREIAVALHSLRLL